MGRLIRVQRRLQMSYRLEQDTKERLQKSGWKPYYADFNIEYFLHLLVTDFRGVAEEVLKLLSSTFVSVGRADIEWWAKPFMLQDYTVTEQLANFWNYITPSNFVHEDIALELSTHKNRKEVALDRLLSIVFLEGLLKKLGTPDIILQNYEGTVYYYPPKLYTDLKNLHLLDTLYLIWKDKGVVVKAEKPYAGATTTDYKVICKDLRPHCDGLFNNLAIIESNGKARSGELTSTYSLSSFTPDVKDFSKELANYLQSNNRSLACLVEGEPGTGKTAWALAFAREVMVPLGYLILILDSNSVANFCPPEYLRKVCVIVNEVDNLALARGDFASASNRTENLLSLLDGTVYNSIKTPEEVYDEQSVVFLFTCNTTERLDPAFLRKGRIDFQHSFTHKYV